MVTSVAGTTEMASRNTTGATSTDAMHAQLTVAKLVDQNDAPVAPQAGRARGVTEDPISDPAIPT